LGQGLSTGKAVLLFILGIILALVAFPTAFVVFFGLSYAFAITAMVLGAYLISKQKGRMLPLVLGIILVVFAFMALMGMAIVHIGMWALKEIAEEITETKSIHGNLGEPIRVENWEISVLGVKEATYIKADDFYYRTKEDYKAVIVTLKIKNVGETIASIPLLWDSVMVSNANKSYEEAYTFELAQVYPVTEDVKSRATTFRELDIFASLAPGTYIEGDLLFLMPKNEEPVKLYFKINSYEIVIELKTS